MTSAPAPLAPSRPGDRFDAACTEVESHFAAHLAAAHRRFLAWFAAVLALETVVLATAIVTTR